jgi:hypothetical protein
VSYFLCLMPYALCLESQQCAYARDALTQYFNPMLFNMLYKLPCVNGDFNICVHLF